MQGEQFRILGPLEVLTGAGGHPVELGSPKQRAVLAILALAPNRVVSVDRLLDQLWGDDPPASALGSLHAYISNLRRVLEPERPPRTAAKVLVSRAPGYLLAVQPEQLDALLFERLAGAGADRLRSGDADGAVGELERALGLWRGMVLADFAYEAFVLPSAERLEDLRRTATEDLIDARLALGQHVGVIAELEQLVGEAPLRERAWAQLIVALYRSGRQGDALRAYERARTVLAEELGLDPGPELRRLEHAVLEHDPELAWGPATGGGGTSPPGSPKVDIGVARADVAQCAAPIGRSAQLERFDHLLSRLAGGSGGTLLVSGEAGVGKTTLLTELDSRSRSAGFTVGWGEFLESGASPPLGAWIDALPPLPAGSERPDLPALLGDGQHGVQGPTTLARLTEQAQTQIREAIAANPLVLVLDDVQWADELSHELLQPVMRMTGSMPLLLALGVRDPVDEPSPKLIETRAALTRLTGLERFELAGLDQHGVDALTQQIAGETAAPEVIRAIYERTAGNPFFVSELARLLSAKHALADVDEMARAGIPVGARDVVRRRLTRLPEQAVVVLSVASVLGPEVDARLLTRMTGIDMDELLDLMDLAAVASLVTEYPEQPGLYRFCHDLVREAIYDALPGLRRARLHERAAAAMIEHYGEVPAIAHALALHSVRAVPATGPDQAIRHLLASARVAQRQLSMDLAETQLRRGLSLLADAPATPERRLLQSHLEGHLAQIQFLIRANGDEALAGLRRAYESCPSDSPERLEVLLQQGSVYTLLGDMRRSLEVTDETTQLARSLGDEQAESDSNYIRALTAWSGDLEVARHAIDSSIAVAEALVHQRGHPTRRHTPLAIKLAWRAVLLSVGGEHDAAESQGATALAEATSAADTWSLNWAAAFVAFGAAIRGDADDVLALWPEVAQRAAGIAYTDSLMEVCRAWATAIGSDRPDLAGLAGARCALSTAGDGLMVVPLALLEADLRQRSDDVEDAAAILREARLEAATRGHLLWMPELDRISANVLAARGDVACAVDQLSEAVAAAERAGLGLFTRRALRDLEHWRGA